MDADGYRHTDQHPYFDLHSDGYSDVYFNGYFHINLDSHVNSDGYRHAD
jgi:hypothetical protein